MDKRLEEATFEKLEFIKGNKYRAKLTFEVEITNADLIDLHRLLYATGACTFSALVEPPPLTPRQQMAAGQMTLDQADTVGGEPVPAPEAVASAILTPEEILAKVAAVLDALSTGATVDTADARIALDFAKAAEAKATAGEALTPEEREAVERIAQIAAIVPVADPPAETSPEGQVGKGDVPDAFRDAFDEQPPKDEPKETRQDEAAE